MSNHCTLDTNISDNKLSLGADLEFFAKFLLNFRFFSIFISFKYLHYLKILDAATALEAELEAPELGYSSCTIVVILFIKCPNNLIIGHSIFSHLAYFHSLHLPLAYYKLKMIFF